MQTKPLAKWAVATALGLLANAADAAVEGPIDHKGLPGSVCVPANPSQAADFRYNGGAIRNVGSATRKVECPILRDGFFGADDAIEELNVFIDQPSRGRTKCTVSITDVRTGEDQRSRGNSGTRIPTRSVGPFTRSTGREGDRRFIFSSLKLSDASIVHLRCELPPNGRIRGILWEERLETDRDEPFGAIKGKRPTKGP